MKIESITIENPDYNHITVSGSEEGGYILPQDDDNIMLSKTGLNELIDAITLFDKHRPTK